MSARTDADAVEHVAAITRRYASRLSAVYFASLPEVQADAFGVIVIHTDQRVTLTVVGRPQIEALLEGIDNESRRHVGQILEQPPGPLLRCLLGDALFPICATFQLALPPPEPLPG